MATPQTLQEPAPIRDSFPSPSLSQADRESLRESFAENGYVIIKNVVSREKLEHFRAAVIEEFERAQRSGVLPAGGGLIAGHLNCSPGEIARFDYDALRESGVIDFVQSVFPRPLGQPQMGCNLNLPKSVVQHYHADSTFTDDFMIVNTAVVDTEIANGAIEVAPGTHKKFYKYWRFAVERPYRRGKRLTMSAGDVLVRTSTLWHRGMPNRTAAPRPMLALTFIQPKRGEPEKPQTDPFLFNEGKTLFYENWYRPTLLGRLRERTVVAAPITYASYRFVRSLFGSKGYGSTL
jgi:ectoine hydroxylase-related dioxygenase (phytanoyl-CoA dioxygenase family)